MLTKEEERNLELAADFEDKYLSPRQRAWQRLLKVAPNLTRFEPLGSDSTNVPNPLANGLFLALCAAFADPVKRDILRALILDLLADDMADIIVGFLTEEEI